MLTLHEYIQSIQTVLKAKNISILAPSLFYYRKIVCYETRE